ncbi:hypothetical protein KIN20_020477 [Parelaphostrongylus tenuis]|uniref:Uncharacterized protein n=1 Tax=Parelaphostrongylus tenuis TaxID=148309 RepID=A0AAD5MSW6_PARTN|nr:hypothetical protein KIN20_020477 [Parelaphostrongylus tenuis]
MFFLYGQQLHTNPVLWGLSVVSLMKGLLVRRRSTPDTDWVRLPTVSRKLACGGSQDFRVDSRRVLGDAVQHARHDEHHNHSHTLPEFTILIGNCAESAKDVGHVIVTNNQAV